jgi:hypothetical protein
MNTHVKAPIHIQNLINDKSRIERCARGMVVDAERAFGVLSESTCCCKGPSLRQHLLLISYYQYFEDLQIEYEVHIHVVRPELSVGWCSTKLVTLHRGFDFNT